MWRAIPCLIAFCVADAHCERCVAESEDAQDAATRTVDPAADELKRLAGVWVNVDRYYRTEREELRPFLMQLSESGELVNSGISIGAHWETHYGHRWRIDPEKSPKEIDYLVGESVFRKIYEVRDDQLFIYSDIADGRIRPAKAEMGSRIRCSVYARGLEKGRKLAAERITEQLSGDWRAGCFPEDAIPWSGVKAVNIKDGAFHFEKSGAKVQYDFSLNPILEENVGAGPREYPDSTTPKPKEAIKPFVPLQIDVKMGETTVQGIYKFDGHRFTFAYLPDDPFKRPDSFEATGAVVVQLTEVKERER